MRRRNALSMISLLPFLAISTAPAWAFGEDDVTAAESAILSAGSRASAVRRLDAVPSVGVVNLSFRSKPRFRSGLPDVSEFKVSAEKNHAGIQRLRAALRANPVTAEAMARHGVSINRVVGVSISSNGSLRVFVI